MSRSLETIINERRSIRSFDDTPVKKEVIESIIEKINLCPTAGNLQSCHIYVVTNTVLIKSICASANQGWIEQAPALMVFCCECREHYYGKRGLELYAIQDATIKQTYATLVCQDHGLKSCWVGSFIETEVSSLLHIPSHLRPIGILPFGYSSANSRHERKHMDITDTVTFYTLFVSLNNKQNKRTVMTLNKLYFDVLG